MTAPEDLKYTAEHEWVRVEGDTATVGVTDYAAQKLGDVVFIELPAVGAVVSAGSVVGEIESTKSVGELFSPLDGTIVAVNDAVADGPELVNTDPYGEGWLLRVRFEDLPELLDSDGYAAHTGE